MSAPTVEERLSALEKKVDLLIERLLPANGDWTSRVIGSFANCPEFDEVIRLGREFRNQHMADDVSDGEFEDSK